MRPELKRLVDEFGDATRRLQHLAATTGSLDWSRRPEPDRWSIAECVEHLNLTAETFLPELREAIDRARLSGRRPPRRYRMDLTGWLLWKGTTPPARIRVKTGGPFVPGADRTPDELLERFEGLQAEQIECVRSADGLAIDREVLCSPFNRRITYNLFSAFSILARHQHRHLWQAERVADALSGSST